MFKAQSIILLIYLNLRIVCTQAISSKEKIVDHQGTTSTNVGTKLSINLPKFNDRTTKNSKRFYIFH